MLGLSLFANKWVFRIKPLKVKLLAGEQKATEYLLDPAGYQPSESAKHHHKSLS